MPSILYPCPHRHGCRHSEAPWHSQWILLAELQAGSRVNLQVSSGRIIPDCQRAVEINISKSQNICGGG